MTSMYFGVRNDVKTEKVIENSHVLPDCKSAAFRFDGSNPSSPTTKSPTPLGVGLFVYLGIWRTDSKD